MNTTELYRLTEWVEVEIVEAGIVQKYQDLYKILQQHVEPSGSRPSFANQRQELINSILQVPLEQLSGNQLVFLTDLDMDKSIGQKGVDAIENALYKNVIDVATSVKIIAQLLNNLKNAISRCSQIKSGLQGVLQEQSSNDYGEVLMRLVFSGKSAIENVADFKYWGESWHEIAYGIAFANGETTEQVKVVGAATGSIVLELSVSSNFSRTASDIVLSALQLTEKVQDINQKVEELRNLQLKNSKLVLDLEKEAEYENRMGAENISDAVIKKIGLRKNGEGDKITALMKAVKFLINFIENGGDVEFILNQPDQEKEDEVQIEDLQETFQQIRELKKKLIQHQEQTDVVQAA